MLADTTEASAPEGYKATSRDRQCKLEGTDREDGSLSCEDRWTVNIPTLPPPDPRAHVFEPMPLLGNLAWDLIPFLRRLQLGLYECLRFHFMASKSNWSALVTPTDGQQEPLEDSVQRVTITFPCCWCASNIMANHLTTLGWHVLSWIVCWYGYGSAV